MLLHSLNISSVVCSDQIELEHSSRTHIFFACQKETKMSKWNVRGALERTASPTVLILILIQHVPLFENNSKRLTLSIHRKRISELLFPAMCADHQ